MLNILLSLLRLLAAVTEHFKNKLLELVALRGCTVGKDICCGM
jgi:hypothetical protein